MHDVRRLFALLVLVLGALAASPIQAAGSAPALAWPVDCRLAEDCWIVHHVDVDSGPGARDFRCGALTYDKHKGTDIALRDRAAIFRPFAVRAAAPGVVIGARDTSPDHLGTKADIKEAMEKKQECGNGVAIAHGDGWVTQYCHLKSGSISVGKGQQVAEGDVLGHIGQSGAAEFPHLHLALRLDKQTIDPFTGLAMGAGCEAKLKGSLWSEAVQTSLPARDAPMLFGAGFRAGAPRYDAILQDMRTPTALPVQGNGLVLWAVFYGVRAGDLMEFSITDPAGGSFTKRRFEQEKHQIRRMAFTGRSNKNKVLRPGVYQGLVRITRQNDGQRSIVVERQVTVTLED